MILSYHIITLDVGCWEYYGDDENTFSSLTCCSAQRRVEFGQRSLVAGASLTGTLYKPEHLTNLIRHQLQSHCLIIYQDKKTLLY